MHGPDIDTARTQNSVTQIWKIDMENDGAPRPYRGLRPCPSPCPSPLFTRGLVAEERHEMEPPRPCAVRSGQNSLDKALPAKLCREIGAYGAGATTSRVRSTGFG